MQKHEVVYVNSHTHIDGNVHADQVVIEGSIRGTIIAKTRVIMKQGSFIKGRIFTRFLEIEDGAECDCEFHIDDSFHPSDKSTDIRYHRLDTVNENEELRAAF